MADPDSGTPRWVKISAAVTVAVAVVVVVLLIVVGDHGPGRHGPGGAEHRPPAGGH